MSIKSHADLTVWQKAMDLVVEVYAVSRQLPKDELYGLTSQLRRAAVSIPANIAEGKARSSRRDYCHFLHIAKGSLAEVDTLITVALRLGFVDAGTSARLKELVDEVGRMLSGLLAKLQQEA
jgi:four helix bundle protein